MEIRNFNKDFGQELFDLVKNKISKHTVQIFNKDDINGFTPDGYSFRYIPIGSGILVKMNGEHYLFSASHILLDGMNPRTLYIGKKGDEFVPIQGNGLMLNDDEIDIGAIKLEEREINELKESFEFLATKNISTTHIINNKDVSEYIITGFPLNDTKFENDHFFSGCSSLITKCAKDEHYEYYKYDKKKHFLLDYYSPSRDLVTLEKRKGK